MKCSRASRRSRSSCKLAVVVGVTLAFLLAGGAGLEPASSQCIASVQYRGRLYLQARTGSIPPVGRPAGRGAFPSCNDFVIPNQPPPPRTYTPVDVFRAGRLDPMIALMTKADASRGTTLYVGPGFLTVLPSHPLHRLIYHQTPVPDCAGRATRISGRLTDSARRDMIFLGFVHHVGPFPREKLTPNYFPVTITERTSVRGSFRLGLPYLPARTRVRITGAFCGDTTVPTFIARKVVAVV